MKEQTETSGTRTSRLEQRRAMRPAIIDPDQLYSTEEAAAARDQCRAGLYNEIHAGLISVIKEGSRTKILGAEIIRRNREVASSAGSKLGRVPGSKLLAR